MWGEKMIKVERLKKNYGEKNALKGINFEVQRKEIFGFLGPNGAGKTTTIKILTGQLLPSFGEATVLGEDASTEADRIYPRIGVVPEQTNLYERLPVIQNLKFFTRLYQSDMKNIDYYLDRVGLSNEKKTPVEDLSKGMKQKVLLVRALLHDPELLFLDEPTSGLDPTSAAKIHQLLLELNQEGKTIMLTSHDMEEVDKLCHRVAFLNEGEIALKGEPDELKLKYNNNKLKVLIETDQKLKEEIIEMNGIESAEKLSTWMEQGIVNSVHSCEPNLADIFVNVTGSEIK